MAPTRPKLKQFYIFVREAIAGEKPTAKTGPFTLGAALVEIKKLRDENFDHEFALGTRPGLAGAEVLFSNSPLKVVPR